MREDFSMTVEGKVAANVAGNSTGTTLINRNPYLYRGYRYDRETGLYYLNSRYYDPETGRFLNADVFVSTGQGVLGNNMFAYCLNNPSTLVDYEGKAAYGACYEQESDIGGWGRFSSGGFVGGAIIPAGYYIDFAEVIGEIFTASTTVIVVEAVQEEEKRNETVDEKVYQYKSESKKRKSR